MTILVQTTLVANANAMLVVVTGMSTHLVLMTARIQSAVLGDVVVVTNLCEATSLVARLQVSILKFWFTRVALQCTTIKLIVLLHFIFFFFFNGST